MIKSRKINQKRGLASSNTSHAPKKLFLQKLLGMYILARDEAH